MKKKNLRLYILFFVATITGWYIFLLHPLTSDLPLWYDPWLYKSMMDAYVWLWGNWDWSMLPEWIQRIYPPYIWMEFSLLQTFVWTSSGWFVHSGILWIVLVLLSWIYYYTKQLFWRKAALISVCFGLTSFVLYNLYWWWYIKQLMAIFFLLMTLWLFLQKKWRAVIPVLTCAMITQRPVIVILVFIFFLWRLVQKNHENKDHRIDYLMAFWVSITAVLSLYWPAISNMLTPLLPFISKIWISSWPDIFQSWWTFLTITDYLITNWVVIVLWLIWGGIVYKKDSAWTKKYFWIVIFLLIRVFAQRMFFQRMIWYLDVFLLVWVWIAWVTIIDRWKWWWVLISILWVVHTVQTIYRHGQIRYPIIEVDEFAFIKQIDTLIEEDSVLIVPWDQYSPWLQWRTNAVIIAPWIFDENKRWTRKRWQRESKWRQAAPEMKCENVLNTYWNISKNMYVWIWSKQELADVTWACFDLIKAWWDPFRALYHLNFDKEQWNDS